MRPSSKRSEGTEDMDMSVNIMGQKLEVPIYCSPTAIQGISS